ncbi:hypothetical protein GOP47_0005507 [Adiantum capillus-veneris]|uniref:Uncharacterized protein n=1 Tax=Adiantum capillus-veneris TaxID=13818 RepID=A0A9D4V6E1_ADICA|nr:hypothetical protein GOP47_0005507 [Adiantum capillus-veneris]
MLSFKHMSLKPALTYDVFQVVANHMEGASEAQKSSKRLSEHAICKARVGGACANSQAVVPNYERVYKGYEHEYGRGYGYNGGYMPEYGIRGGNDGGGGGDNSRGGGFAMSKVLACSYPCFSGCKASD